MKNILFGEYKHFLKCLFVVLFVSFIVGYLNKFVFDATIYSWFLVDTMENIPLLSLLSKLLIISIIWYYIHVFDFKYRSLYDYLMIRYNSKRILISNLLVNICLLIIFVFISQLIVGLWITLDLFAILSLIFIQILKITLLFLIGFLLKDEYQLFMILGLLIFIETFFVSSWIIQFIVYFSLCIIFILVNSFLLLFRERKY